jgi:hypothetical protein
MQKKFKISLVIFLLLVVFSIATRLVLADDDDEEDDDRPVTSSSSSSNSGTKTEVTTNVSTETIVQKDSDGDGLLDPNDPHLNIPEIYIVSDDNRNGIVDRFEK